MTDSVAAEIEKAQEQLRSIDGTLAALSGRAAGNGLKRRISNDIEPIVGFRRSGVEELPVRGIRRRIEYEDVPNKRMRDDIDEEDRPKRTLQSTVVMPTIETKSRDAAISEMNKELNTEVKQRNRRLFSSLVVGTLQRFQKDEKKISSTEKAQVHKLAEVEKKLEETKREERERVMKEKESLLAQRRDQERELRALQRKKALIQYAEQKKEHYQRLQNFIQTKARPTLFFLPAKHTLHSLELLKQSASAIEGLIDMREKELQTEMEKGQGMVFDEEQKRPLRSHIAARARDRESVNGEDEEEEVEEGVKKREEEEVDGDESAAAPRQEPSVEVTLQGEESDKDDE